MNYVINNHRSMMTRIISQVTAMRCAVKTALIALLLVTLVGCESDASPPVEAVETKVLNPNHRFVIDRCDIQYNGQPVVLGDSIDNWVKVLGPYDRKVELANDIYVWDEVGLQLYSRYKKERVISMNFMFNLAKDARSEKDIELVGWDGKRGEDIKEDIRQIIRSRPTKFFQGAFQLDGVLMDENVDFDAINNARYEYAKAHYDLKPGDEVKMFGESYLPGIYSYWRKCQPGGWEMKFRLDTLPDDPTKIYRMGFGHSTLARQPVTPPADLKGSESGSTKYH